jgi:hypothetical protein
VDKCSDLIADLAKARILKENGRFCALSWLQMGCWTGLPLKDPLGFQQPCPVLPQWGVVHTRKCWFWIFLFVILSTLGLKTTPPLVTSTWRVKQFCRKVKKLNH